jgi:hypothetical protein
MTAPDIVATCCESVEGNCVKSFPATCPHTCAQLLVPWIDQCGSMMTAVPDETFPTFKVSKLRTFSDACRQTLILFERASSGTCTSEGEGEGDLVLKGRIEAVNSACCEQDNVNICTAGTPQTCDAGMSASHSVTSAVCACNAPTSVVIMLSAHSFGV